MRWLVGLFAPLLVFLLLFIAPVVGFLVQPWAPWWVSKHEPQTIVVGPGGNIPLPGPEPAPAPGPISSDLLMQAIQPFLAGPTPYVFGGCSIRGIDCSCFVLNVLSRLGVSLPRTAQAQWNATDRVDQPRYGDLVFFQHTYDAPDRITHVGFYMGSNRMISAAEPAVGWQSLDSPFWRAHLAGFGRPRGVPPPRQA